MRNSVVTANGTRLQSGIPKRRAHSDPSSMYGTLTRGVVMATYVVDDEAHPFADRADYIPNSIYCDVLTYPRYFLLQSVPVSQPGGGLHDGWVWKPKATTIDLGGNEEFQNPATMDGDHVLVGFIDNLSSQPIILRGLPHPSRDVGTIEKETGHRLRLKLADGDPHFLRHHGTVFGLDDSGDFVLDTTATFATMKDDGAPDNPPEDGTVGNVNWNLQKGATVSIISAEGYTFTLSKDKCELKLQDGATVNLSGKDANATMTVGDGAVSVAIADTLNTLWSTLKSTLDTWGGSHTHTYIAPAIPSSPTPTIPPIAPALSVPAYDAGITSTKVKIPNG